MRYVLLFKAFELKFKNRRVKQRYMELDDYKEYAPVVLRIGVSLLMLWFGFTNILSPNTLVGYLSPSFTNILPVSPLTFMIINGIVEILFGLALLLGCLTRTAALLTSLHILGIAINLGYNDIAIRDYALAIAAFAVFLHGADKLCLYKKW